MSAVNTGPLQVTHQPLVIRKLPGRRRYFGVADLLCRFSVALLMISLAVTASASPESVNGISLAASGGSADNLPPQAAFTYQTIEGLSSRQVAFDAKRSQDNVAIVGYEWRFGDGTYLSGSNAVSVVHSYPSGEYNVTLTVVDAAGHSATHTETVGGESATTAVILAEAKKSPDKPAAKLLTPPVGLAPEPDAIVIAGSTTGFTWKTQVGADLYDFRILNASDEVSVRIGEFAASSICSRSRCKLTQDLNLEAANGYTWQVRAHNRAGWSQWSDNPFSVHPPDLKKPRMPLSLYPGADSTVNNDETITFLWEHKPSVDSYRFQLLNRANGKILVDTRAHSRMFCNPTQCAYSRPITLPVGDNYAWQIQAANLAGESGWFRTSFEVVRNDKQAVPVAAFDYALAGTDPMSVEFNAASSSADTQINEYKWSFGDGDENIQVSDQARINYQYARGGSYLVTLTVTDTTGASSQSEQLINVGEGTVPQAHFLIDGFDSDAVGAAPFLATFDPSASSDDSLILSYTWDFGDGSDIIENGDAAVVSHSYTAEGEYTVELTVKDDSGLKAIHSRLVTVSDSADALSVTEAGRLISQATFGATDDEISRLMETGFDAWLNEQFRLKGEPHLQYVKQFSAEQGRSARHEIWWQDAIHGKDQLRQRVALALSQIFAIDADQPALTGLHAGVAAYYDLLREHAFGNYKDLLKAVALNPVVGLHTGMLRNSKEGISISSSSSRSAKLNTRVDQGFARLLLRQLTLGDYLLQPDGQVTQNRQPAYTEKHIENIARALTGWNLSDAEDWEQELEEELSSAAWEHPMVPFETYHDVNTKVLLDEVATPPALTAREDLELVLDNVFAHPNVGPFVVKQLIQKLVTSNPSPGYVKRIASVFDNNGTGVRGDLQAVIRALLLDAEARNAPATSDFGKLREPLLRLAHLWRAFGVQPGTASVGGEYNAAGVALQDLDQVTGQQLLGSAALYGLTSPDFAPVGAVKAAGLAAPDFSLFTAEHVLSTTTLLNRQIHRHYTGTPHSDDLQVAYLDFSAEYKIANNSKTLLRRLDRILLAGTMSDDLFQVLQEHIDAVPDNTSGRVRRVHDAVSLIMVSPDYLVQM